VGYSVAIGGEMFTPYELGNWIIVPYYATGFVLRKNGVVGIVVRYRPDEGSNEQGANTADGSRVEYTVAR
jgi:hypothetical protein